MRIILLILILISIYISIPCRIICENSPCFSTSGTTNTYTFNVHAFGDCNFSIILNDGTVLETIFISSGRAYKSIFLEDIYNLNINKVSVKKGEKYCSGNPIIGNSNKECVGKSTDTTINIAIRQLFPLKDFINNDDQQIFFDKKLNVSINKDISKQFRIVSIPTRQLTSDKNGVLIFTTYTIPNSGGSTYNINGLTEPNDNVVGIPPDINYNFNMDIYDDCYYQELNPNLIQNPIEVNCDTCEITTTKYKLSNIPKIDSQICRDLYDNSVSVRNISSIYSITINMENNQLLQTNYLPKQNIATRVEFNLFPYLDFCLIEVIQSTNNNSIIHCNLKTKITGDTVLVDKIYNSYIFVYKDIFLMSYVRCSTTVLDCGSTLVRLNIKERFIIEKTENVVVGKDDIKESLIGWWMFFQQIMSLQFWLNQVWTHIISIIICIITTLIFLYYINKKIDEKIRKIEYSHLF